MLGVGFNTWLALASYMLAMFITPGPNNMIMMSSAANVGFVRSLPAILGVALGIPFLLLVVGLGLAQAFTKFPLFYTMLKWAGVIYLLVFAYQLATSEPRRSLNPAIEGKGGAAKQKTTLAKKSLLSRPSLSPLNHLPRHGLFYTARQYFHHHLHHVFNPVGFFSVAAFQWMNPKTLIMVVNCFSTYLPANYGLRILGGALGISFILSLFTCSLWALLGLGLAEFLQQGNRQRHFNITMAIVLLLSMVPALLK
ncbi:MAG: LysE family transporter [Hydrotalea sp.]|nr:LysE family transporter [Hydrotalea sp.]